MYDFFCNKRYDISFSDFHKLIKLVLPTNYVSRESRGFYKKDYVPCNIIAIKPNDDISNELNIYCWLGSKGLTVLADDELTSQICFEVLKNVKQNPEEHKSDVLMFDEFSCEQMIELIEPKEQYSIFEQKNYYDGLIKYLIKETNGDEVELVIDTIRKSITLSGSNTSLYTFIYIIIDKLTRNIQNKAE